MLETLLVSMMFQLLAVLILVCATSGLRSGKIVGGSHAKENSTPFMAGVQKFDGWKFEHKCGGAIVHEYFVLTASHCLKDLKVNEVRILVGSIEISKGTSFHVPDKFLMHER